MKSSLVLIPKRHLIFNYRTQLGYDTDAQGIHWSGMHPRFGHSFSHGVLTASKVPFVKLAPEYQRLPQFKRFKVDSNANYG
jgi:hypothetical protein